MLDRNDYDRFRVAPTDPATLRCTQVESIVKQLADSWAGKLKLEKFDESNEKRPIYLLTLGSGPRRVLLWSQMHGDEPTHTAVMLDLFNYLLQQPANPKAEEILAGCTLMFIPMLNPDGAEVGIRFNAQGIDINRDWRRLATPEGRALLRAAKTLQPQFGFNLHNQNARTSVGRPPRLAAVSVLAPAPDNTRKETPSWRAAKQMCTCFVDAVRPFAEGMISRYDDTYEPRAFGDGIQSLGISTMLVEVGGWPDIDPEPMTRLHFHGMLNSLHAIATDDYRQADTHIYESLPESNSQRMSDCFVTKGHVFDAKSGAPFIADFVIDHTHTSRLAFTSSGDGKIIEIGDLPGVPARLTINAADTLVLPGCIVYLPDWSPGKSINDRRIMELLALGATSAIGILDLANHDSLEALADPLIMPINWGFVGNADGIEASTGSQLLEHLATASANGLLAVVSSAGDESLWRQVHQFGLPLLKPTQLPTTPAGSYREHAVQVWETATALNQQSRRGRINRDYFADLLFFRSAQSVDLTNSPDWKKLTRIMVAGEIVWENGRLTGAMPGAKLRRPDFA